MLGVQNPITQSPLPSKTFLAAAIAVCALMLSLGAPRAVSAEDSVPSQTLRNVAGIVAHRDGHSVPIGTAFFVAVPSKIFEGRSFVYVVTAHHNLLDSSGRAARWPLPDALEDSRTGAMREEALPPESRWVLNPVTENSDVAATPLNPAGSRIAPISLDSIMATTTEMNALAETGAQAYYLTAASVGSAHPRFEALARFGRVSVSRPADAEVPGAGTQQLCFMDGGVTPGFSALRSSCRRDCASCCGES